MEKRLGLHENEEKDLQYRRPPARVSSLRSKPSEPKTPWISPRDVHRISSGRQTDRTIRPSMLEKKPEALSSSPSPPLSPSLEPGPDAKGARAELPDSPDDSSPIPTPKPRKSPIRRSRLDSDTPLRESADSSLPQLPQSPPPSSPKPLESPQTSMSSSLKDHRPGSKPPLPPKPRLSSTEKPFARRSDLLNHAEERTAPPDSPPAIRRLVAPTEPPPPPPPSCNLPESQIPNRHDAAPPAPHSIVPPDSLSAAPITKDTETPDLDPPSPGQQQKPLELSDGLPEPEVQTVLFI